MKLENSIHMLMNRVMHLYISRGMEILGEENIKPGQGGLLLMLQETGGLSQREIAERLNVKPPSITVMLRKMERNGYISRTQDQNDQRITRIYITEEGDRAAGIMKKAIDQLEGEVYQGITKEEVLFMRRLLLQMETNLDRAHIHPENARMHFHNHRRREDI